MSWIQPLELDKLLINVLAGNMLIFITVSLVAIVGLSAYFRMKGTHTLLMLGLFMVMFMRTIEPLSIVVITLISIGVYYWIARMVSK